MPFTPLETPALPTRVSPALQAQRDEEARRIVAAEIEDPAFSGAEDQQALRREYQQRFGGEVPTPSARAHRFTPLAADDSPTSPGPAKSRFTPIEDPKPSVLKTIALNNPLTALGEAGLNLASQVVALPAAGLAGLATEAGRVVGLTDKTGADVVHQVGDALTYQPRGEMGKAAAEVVAYPFEKLAEGGQYVGGKVLDATDSPVLATAADTAINALPMAIDPALRAGRRAMGRSGSAAGTDPSAARDVPDSAPSSATAPAAKYGFTPLAEAAGDTAPARQVANAEPAPVANARFAVVDADQLRASHDALLKPTPDYPAELGRPDWERGDAAERVRAIVQDFDPQRLGQAADDASGAPVVGSDGIVEAGNARAVALKRVYQANGQKAENYRTWLADNASEFGLSPEQVATIKKPVLVRLRADQPHQQAAILAPDMAAAAGELAGLKQAGADLGEGLAQAGVDVQSLHPETLAIVQHLAEGGRLPQDLINQLSTEKGPNHAETPRHSPADHAPDTQRRYAGEDPVTGATAGVEPPNAASNRLGNQGYGPAGAALTDLHLGSDVAFSQVEAASRRRPPAADSGLPGDGQANAFAPGANYVGFIDDRAGPAPSHPPGAEISGGSRPAPIRREDILVPFLKALDTGVYEGRVKGKGVMGFFRPATGEVRVKRHADLESTAHEIAHLIDHRTPEIRKTWIEGKNWQLHREELRGLSYDRKKIYEGFAEFVRHYMTQPEVAKMRAPTFYQWFEDFLGRHEYGKAIKKAQAGMVDWFAQDALDRARSKIGDHRPLSESLDGRWDAFRQATVDDLHGVYRMERELNGGKIAPNGAYESARLSRAAQSIADGAIRYGAPVKKADGAFTWKGKGLEEILRPVAGDLDNALLYFVGRSSRELAAQGREHLFTPGEIDAMLRLRTPEFEKAFSEYQAWNSGILDFAEQQGIINPAARALWQRTQYLPFHRVAQADGFRGKPGDWSGIKALTGGTENIRDILGNMTANAAMLIDKAVKNEARQKIADLAAQAEGGKFMAKIEAGSRPMKVDKTAVIDALLKSVGLEKGATATPAAARAREHLQKMFEDSPGMLELMQHNMPPGGGNVVAVLKDGKPVWHEVGDPILLRALQAIDREPPPWITKWLGLPKRVGQATITMTPDFMVANIARDTIMGSVMSRAGFRPIIDSLNGMRLRVTNDPIYREFVANGGGLSSIFLDEAKFRAKLSRFYQSQGISYKTVLNTPEKLLGFIETLGDAFESSTRLGEYKRAVDSGVNPRHAAYLAREISTDFAMRGDSKPLGFLYDTVMFLRPAVVSMDRLFRGVAHDPNRGAIATKAGMLALMSAALYLLNRSDPRYQDLPDWDRDSHWHFFVGDQHFRYPKIWEVGALASVAERSVEKLVDDDAHGLGGDFARILGATFNLNFMPQLLAPLYEQATNRTGFTKAPIETPGMEDMQPFLRAKPTTSETLKAAGMATRDLPEALQINPVRTEALLRGYFNTFAMYGLALSDKAFFDDKTPAMRTDQLPVVRRFYAQEPAQHTKYETQFYDMLGEASRLRGTLRELDKIGRSEIADDKEKAPMAGEYRPLEVASKSLASINQEMRAIRRSADTPEEKRAKLDKLTEERNQLLKTAVKETEASIKATTKAAAPQP